MTLYKWSQTASSDATADSTINWAEGQSPSSVNDSARAMMAATAKYRDDIAGAIVTGGTSTAYTVSSYEVFDSLTHLNGQMIAFTPHTTNGATVTLNVDGLGAKPLRTSPSVELLLGTLVQGTPYVAVYNNSDATFYLQGFYGNNPYNVPLAGGMDFWGTSLPNSSFAFPAGQAVSRITYSTLFAIMSTTYGIGDGSTTFNLPDKTGRVSAMKETSAVRLTSTYFAGNSTVMGATGGAESVTLTAPQLPSSIPFTDPGHGHPGSVGAVQGNGLFNVAGTASPGSNNGTTNNTQALTIASNTIGITINPSGGNPHRTVQPTIVCNYIIRII
jgi:microcystin-dependent protein